MSDTHQRYCAIKAALRQVITVVPDSHSEKPLTTLTALICGLADAHHSHLPKLADHAPSQGAKRESRIERFERWLRQLTVRQATYFMPFARALLAALASQPLVLSMDGSTVGRRCQALLLRHNGPRSGSSWPGLVPRGSGRLN